MKHLPAVASVPPEFDVRKITSCLIHLCQKLIHLCHLSVDLPEAVVQILLQLLDIKLVPPLLYKVVHDRLPHVRGFSNIESVTLLCAALGNPFCALSKRISDFQSVLLRLRHAACLPNVSSVEVCSSHGVPLLYTALATHLPSPCFRRSSGQD